MLISFDLRGDFSDPGVKPTYLPRYSHALLDHPAWLVVIVKTVARTGDRGEPCLFLHGLEDGIPVPAFHEFVMEIGMLQAHPGLRRNLVDTAGDGSRNPGQAFLAECDPFLPQDASVLVGLEGLDKGGAGKGMLVSFIEKADAKIAETAFGCRRVLGDPQVIVNVETVRFRCPCICHGRLFHICQILRLPGAIDRHTDASVRPHHGPPVDRRVFDRPVI